ncbi:hypothetical protein [Kribbella sindirgiensis]|uniref:Uncharacterized protein n=1 Tax=Kribbella sindirgiensis TaxID=1124744 RepID=A0A4R0JD70_9ACTN|nr:hypothetical protein [Kribbella sindirgiensis]TCC43444.1 hypothetical protein E0H50_02970 [Kribbella sindirgiensis]
MSTPPSGPNYSWQPQPGDYKSAPTYGQPPRKSRAGLIIVLIVVLALVALGAIGVLAYRLVSNHRTSDPNPGTAATSPRSAAGKPTTTTRPTARPTTARPTARPSTARPSTTGTGAAGAIDLARRFVTQLNANNSATATALACESSRQLIPTLMKTFLTPPTELTAGKLVGQQTTFVIPLTGTTKGSTVTGVIVVHEIAPEPLCIRAFQISPT